MAGRRGSDVDHHVGRRIRQRRNALGMSQAKLGKALGVSFQQLQKYELGIDRVAAGRLWNISKALEVDVDYFFAGSLVEPQPTPMPAGALQQRAALVRDFPRISSSGTRAAILSLVREAARAKTRRPKK